LAQHDVLRNTTTIVQFADSSGLEENLHSFLKGAAHQGARVSTVDAVSSHSSDTTAIRHDIDKKRHMPMVNVGTTESKHLS
jgi:hypothetical protein